MLQKYTSESDNTTRAIVRGKVGYIKEYGQNWSNVYIYPSEDAQYVRAICSKEIVSAVKTGESVELISLDTVRQYIANQKLNG